VTDLEELDTYLRDFRAGGYPVAHVREVVCAACSGRTFSVLVDVDEQGSAVTCEACGEQVAIADSEEYLDEAELEECQCPCGGESFAAAVGYALTSDATDVRWISLALLCRSDGQIGVYTDWKIDYGPSLPLIDQFKA
jgi:hypothetical protein